METSITKLVVNAKEAAHSGGVRRAGVRRKRAVDVTLGIGLVVVFLPLLVLLAVALVVQGRPYLIRHQRVGLGGKGFPCLKFRTMVVDAQSVLERHLESDPEAAAEWAASRKLRNDPRVTQLGRILRKSSLDELPQLFNVISGHMSLVGPRPIVEAEKIHYGDQLPHYVSVKPGLTGPWQIGGRSDTSYATRVRLDSNYAQSYSLVNDVAIMVKTIPAVLLARGSY